MGADEGLHPDGTGNTFRGAPPGQRLEGAERERTDSGYYPALSIAREYRTFYLQAIDFVT